VYTVSSATADSLPNRKPGLWEVSVSTDTKGASHPMKMTQCTDETTDAKLMQTGNDIQGQAACSKNEITKTSSGYKISSVCKLAGSTVSSNGTFTGDFASEYGGDITTSFEPPVFGQTGSTTTIRAKWLGACPSDMKPGDMLLPNGMKMNVDQAAQSAKQAAKMLDNPEIAQAMKQMPEGMNKEMANAMKEMMQQMGE
jgi:hypothetical protein